MCRPCRILRPTSLWRTSYKKFGRTVDPVESVAIPVYHRMFENSIVVLPKLRMPCVADSYCAKPAMPFAPMFKVSAIIASCGPSEKVVGCTLGGR